MATKTPAELTTITGIGPTTASKLEDRYSTTHDLFKNYLTTDTEHIDTTLRTHDGFHTALANTGISNTELGVSETDAHAKLVLHLMRQVGLCESSLRDDTAESKRIERPLGRPDPYHRYKLAPDDVDWTIDEFISADCTISLAFESEPFTDDYVDHLTPAEELTESQTSIDARTIHSPTGTTSQINADKLKTANWLFGDSVTEIPENIRIHDEEDAHPIIIDNPNGVGMVSIAPRIT